MEETEGMCRTHRWTPGPHQLPDSWSAMGRATRPRTVGRWLERLGISRRRDLGPTGGSNRLPGVIRARYRGHMDVKKVGRIPAGGGWRVHGCGTDAASTITVTPNYHCGFRLFHVKHPGPAGRPVFHVKHRAFSRCAESVQQTRSRLGDEPAQPLINNDANRVFDYQQPPPRDLDPEER